MNDVSGKFDVGYGKPPQQHRFQKGQSGNPKGRPRSAKNKPKPFDPAPSAHRRADPRGGLPARLHPRRRKGH